MAEKITPETARFWLGVGTGRGGQHPNKAPARMARRIIDQQLGRPYGSERAYQRDLTLLNTPAAPGETAAQIAHRGGDPGWGRVQAQIATQTGGDPADPVWRQAATGGGDPGRIPEGLRWWVHEMAPSHPAPRAGGVTAAATAAADTDQVRENHRDPDTEQVDAAGFVREFGANGNRSRATLATRGAFRQGYDQAAVRRTLQR